jgi:N-acyl amino acid synthase of PEP-CTERM/exosortase system
MLQFHFRKVVDKAELEEVFRLRYKVYCDEWGFEKPEDHPGGLEFDVFDSSSRHFISLNERWQIIGTVRIILNSEKGFPIENHCTIDADLTHLNRDKIGEISRLAVSKEFRKRFEDRFIYDGTPESVQEQAAAHERRRRHEIVTGLYKSMYVESKKIGLTHWYAVMAKGLYILLKRMGIIFKPIGPEIYYHGIRTPYLGSIADIEDEVSRLNPELFREFQEALK